jgi:hypothetical protein
VRGAAYAVVDMSAPASASKISDLRMSIPS